MVNLTFKKVRITAVELVADQADNPNYGYIGIAPVTDVAIVGQAHERFVGLANGYAWPHHIQYIGGHDFEGHCSLISTLYHDTSVRHQLKVHYEVLEP